MKAKAKAGSGGTSGDSQAEALENELLQEPPKGKLDKMRVLRSRLKRLSSKLPDRVSSSPAGDNLTPEGGAGGLDSQQVGFIIPPAMPRCLSSAAAGAERFCGLIQQC